MLFIRKPLAEAVKLAFAKGFLAHNESCRRIFLHLKTAQRLRRVKNNRILIFTDCISRCAFYKLE